MRKTFFALILASNLIFASDLKFTSSDSQIYINSNDENSIGIVELATPVEVLELKDKMAKIKLKGWSADGFENVLFADIGKRIIYLNADEKIKKYAKVLQNKIDDYDSSWNEVSYEIWIKKSNLIKSKDKALEEGAEIYENSCGACHASPSIKHYTVNQWPNIIKSMETRAGLMQEERQAVIKFLQNQVK